MQTLSFVPINLHRCCPREWKRFIDFLACLFCLPIADHVMLPKRTVSFKSRPIHAHPRTYACMTNEKKKGKLPREHHVLRIGKTKHTRSIRTQGPGTIDVALHQKRFSTNSSQYHQSALASIKLVVYLAINCSAQSKVSNTFLRNFVKPFSIARKLNNRRVKRYLQK